jgi:hypothetical protein
MAGVRMPSGVLALRGLGFGACKQGQTRGASGGSQVGTAEQTRTPIDQARVHAACGRELTGEEEKVVSVTPNVRAKR